MKIHLTSDKCRVTGDVKEHPAHAMSSCHSSRVTRHRAQGMALVITLIMLAVTLVMAVAFMALAKRQRASVTTTTEATTARLATETAVANAQAQIVANIFSSFTNGGYPGAYNLRLLVSTNYINPVGFNTQGGPNNFGPANPTNVSYLDQNGNWLAGNYLEQNIANLFFLPRVPVLTTTDTKFPAGRFFLDLNRNGAFEDSGWIPNLVTNGNVLQTNGFISQMGDPQWVGVLEHPDAPHSANNPFVSRYAFIALPAGNSLDINGVHNQANNVNLGTQDGFMRNQGVGAWEINLAAFLADLNTNIWSGPLPLPDNNYYAYNWPFGSANLGHAFDDARALLNFRYNYLSLPSARNVFFNAPNSFPFDGMDTYSRGPLQTNLDYYRFFQTPAVDTAIPWSGADNPNHYFSVDDFFDYTKTTVGLSPVVVAAGNDFTDRLRAAGNAADTYGRYTYYRMLDELGTDSTADSGKINLNYSNAVVNYNGNNGLVTSVSVVAGAETNLVAWNPTNFFHAAADQMLRLYTSNWFNADATSNKFYYTNTFAVRNTFCITNIPVWISNRFVYTPAVHRILQLAANLYDATTNGFPHVFRPVFKRVNNNGDIVIDGYTQVISVSGTDDPQLQAPYNIMQLGATPLNKPILNSGVPINVYGVPWIIGAKKNLPGFSQLSMVSSAQFERLLEVVRNMNALPHPAIISTNQMLVMNVQANMGVALWNSYSNDYVPSGNLVIAVNDLVQMTMTNSDNAAMAASPYSFPMNFLLTTNFWAGSKWAANGAGPPQDASIKSATWTNVLVPQLAYDFANHKFTDTNSALAWDPTLSPLPQFGLRVTNQIQAYILDGNHVIDYVQFRDPITSDNLNIHLVDNGSGGAPNYYMWSTNLYNGKGPSWGIMDQYLISTQPVTINGNTAATPRNPPGCPVDSVACGRAFFSAVWAPDSKYYYLTHTYTNLQPVSQAPYTATRRIFVPFLYQVNDPLVHYTAGDLNAGAGAQWQANPKDDGKHANGTWLHKDDFSVPLPIPPTVEIVNGRYQPWSKPVPSPSLLGVSYNFDNPYNLVYKDPLVWSPDYWDFPTNSYPTVGWIGRVHRGTPWQSVYLKAHNVLHALLQSNKTADSGTNTWMEWTGDGNRFDAANSGPLQDRLLFDVFTTAFNDNATRGTLSVNQTHLAAWSALFSGMVALTNNDTDSDLGRNQIPYYGYNIIQPAGVDGFNSPLGNLVTNINLARAIFTNADGAIGTFEHKGDILSVAALTEASPFLNHSGVQQTNGIGDAVYEWLPQQMMGLVRLGDTRFVVYGWGQTLKEAPGGEVLSSGPFFKLITNYQVVAESAVRAVIRVDNATGKTPHAVVESYNVLPSN